MTRNFFKNYIVLKKIRTFTVHNMLNSKEHRKLYSKNGKYYESKKLHLKRTCVLYNAQPTNLSEYN